MFKFLGMTRIEDNNVEDYKQKIKDYKQHAEDFYKAGKNTFLSEGVHIGSKETFYMHVLRYYIPIFAEEVFTEHGLGIGIFNMQGFERRNKESKNCLNRFSNMKGNICMNNLLRLYDIFYAETNAY